MNRLAHLTADASTTALAADRILETDWSGMGQWQTDGDTKDGVCVRYDSIVDADAAETALREAGMLASVATSSDHPGVAWLYVAPADVEEVEHSAE